MLSKRKLAAIMLSSVLAIGVTVGGATYALFTSSATNTNNSFAAGTVILNQDRDQGDTVPGPMFYSSDSDPTGSFPYDTNKNPYQPPGGEAIGGWAPGDTVIRAMNIYNDGTLQVKINKLKANVNSAGVTSGDAYNEFIDKMNIKVMYPSTDIILYEGKLSGLLNGYVNVGPILANPNGGPVNITFKANLSQDAGNIIQGQTFVFDFTFSAEQTKNNP